MLEPIEITTPGGPTPGDVIDALDLAVERLAIITMRLARRERMQPETVNAAIRDAANARSMVTEFANR